MSSRASSRRIGQRGDRRNGHVAVQARDTSALARRSPAHGDPGRPARPRPPAILRRCRRPPRAGRRRRPIHRRFATPIRWRRTRRRTAPAAVTPGPAGSPRPLGWPPTPTRAHAPAARRSGWSPSPVRRRADRPDRRTGICCRTINPDRDAAGGAGYGRIGDVSHLGHCRPAAVRFRSGAHRGQTPLPHRSDLAERSDPGGGVGIQCVRSCRCHVIAAWFERSECCCAASTFARSAMAEPTAAGCAGRSGPRRTARRSSRRLPADPWMRP